MYFAVLVPNLQQTHNHSDAVLAQRGARQNWLVAVWRRLRAPAA